MKLVIVESPNKCQTISKYLGAGYEVVASKGHVRDLAIRGKYGFGIDPDKNFEATYAITQKGIVAGLNTLVKKADEVYLATDPDREGEAIAWHLSEVLKLNPKTTKRLEFHEITKESIEEAIKSPRIIDMSIVDSQETRRIIDRVIGFRLSNLMNKKIKSKSAGRVQSATLKLICDHDDEIKAFVPQEYWNLSLDLFINDVQFTAKYDGKIEDKKTNDELLSKLTDKVIVSNIKKSKSVTESKPPFTTSTLQQEAYNAYGFSVATTTRIAQKLYEGFKIGDEHVGLVTYIRTDDNRLANSYVDRALTYIKDTYGEDYIGKRKVSKVKGAQQGHEAIRPTSNHRTPESIRQYLKPEEYKLYKLIYDRTIKSLMASKIDEVTTTTLTSGGVDFKYDFSKNVFPGYSVLNSKEEQEKIVPTLKLNDEVNIEKVNNTQEFTKAPNPYSEGKIVKVMEEAGIGRPSTYASTIATLIKRGYVKSEKGLITSTEQGQLTNHILVKYFNSLVDAKYTADMESDLDKISDGKLTEAQVLKDFYYPFNELVDTVTEKMYAEEEHPTGELCPDCGAPLVVKHGRFGDFVGCSNFPKCSYIKQEDNLEYTGETCPVCGKPMVWKINKKHKKFAACSGYPECKYIKTEKVEAKISGKKCPECGGDLVIRGKGKKLFLGCSNFPKCKHIESYKK